MTKNSEGFHEVNFYVDQMPGCCGIGVVFNFEEDSGHEWDWRSSRQVNKKPEYKTKKEQVDALYKNILGDTGNPSGDYFTTLMITLVSSYAKDGSHQFKELEDKLLEEGWTINQVFINPNHGNEVTVYSKYFPERDMHPKELAELNGDYYDDDDDVY